MPVGGVQDSLEYVQFVRVEDDMIEYTPPISPYSFKSAAVASASQRVKRAGQGGLRGRCR